MAGWKRLAKATADGTSSTLSVSFTATDSFKLQVYGQNTSGAGNFQIRFNNDTNANRHKTRRVYDGAGTSSNRYDDYSDTKFISYSSTSALQSYMIIDVHNIDNEEHLVMGNSVESGATGAGSSGRPHTVNWMGKYTEKTPQVTSVQLITNSNNLNDKSYIVVLATADDVVSDEKTTLTNVPINSRYEEVDTRKIFRAKSGKTWTESTQDNWWSMYENYYYGVKLGASFELNGKTISQVEVWLKKDGSPTYNTTVEVIRGSTVEATSATVAMSTVTSTTGEWITYTFSSGVALQENDYIVFKQDGNQSSSNYVHVGNATKSGTVTTWWSNSPFSAQSHSGVIVTMRIKAEGITNAQTYSIFSETDTGKDYIWSGSAWTEVA